MAFELRMLVHLLLFLKISTSRCREAQLWPEVKLNNLEGRDRYKCDYRCIYYTVGIFCYTILFVAFEMTLLIAGMRPIIEFRLLEEVVSGIARAVND